MKFNEEKVDEYLQLQHVSLVRQCLWGWLIFVLAVGIPASIFGAWKEYTKLILPPIIFSICVWDIWLLINTEKKQKAYILFLGVYCIFLSSLLLLASYKVAYTIDSFPLILYIIVTSLIYITISLCSFFCFRLFLSKPHTNTKKNKTNVAVKIIVAFSLSGMIIGRITSHLFTDRTQKIIEVVILLLIAYALDFGLLGLYKYYLIRKRDNLQ